MSTIVIPVVKNKLGLAVKTGTMPMRPFLCSSMAEEIGYNAGKTGVAVLGLTRPESPYFMFATITREKAGGGYLYSVTGTSPSSVYQTGVFVYSALGELIWKYFRTNLPVYLDFLDT